MCDCKKHLHADARCTCHCIHDDSLPEWLFYRFGGVSRDDEISLKPTKGDDGAAWMALRSEDRAYWQHEADAVRRAVDRNGFKNYAGASPAIYRQDEPDQCGTFSNGQQCRYMAHGENTQHTFGGGLSDPVHNRHCGNRAFHTSHAWPEYHPGVQQWNCSGSALGPDTKITARGILLGGDNTMDTP